MLEIDGSQKSGSGTILRMAVALAATQGEPLHIYNIRQNRPQPGLKPQHLEAVLAAARLCDAELYGAALNSRELWFKPKAIKGGRVKAEIGTAGSIPMLIMTVLPMCAFAETPVELHIMRGGTDVQHSPAVNYLRLVLLPVLERMGLVATLSVQKYGYYPKGNGEATIVVEPCRSLKPLRLEAFGDVKAIAGISIGTFLADRNVAERQAKAAVGYLGARGCGADICVRNDTSNPLQKGSSIVLWAETSEGVILGADAIGEPRKPSEQVGAEAAEKLWAELSAEPTVDVHLADMLIPYFALAPGKSVYFTRVSTEHLETNILLAEMILKRRFYVERKNSLIEVGTLSSTSDS